MADRQMRRARSAPPGCAPRLRERRSSAAFSRSSARAALFARLGQRLHRGRGGLVERGLPRLGLLQPVGGGLAQAVSASDSCDSRARRLVVDLVRAPRPAFQLPHRLLAALAERRDLRRRRSSARSSSSRARRRSRRAGAGASRPRASGPHAARAHRRARRGRATPSRPRARSAVCELAEVGRRAELALRLRRAPRSPRQDPRRCAARLVERRRGGRRARRRHFSARASASRASPTAALRVAPGLARRRLPRRRCSRTAFPRPRRAPPRPTARQRRRHRLGIELDEPVLLGEPLRGGGRRIGAGGEAVPAPERAFAADQPLAGRKQRLQAAPVGGIDDADLREAPGELARRAHDGCQAAARPRAAPDRRRRPALAPMHRRAAIERRVEIVAECGAERGLEAAIDADLRRAPAETDRRSRHSRILASVRASVSMRGKFGAGLAASGGRAALLGGARLGHRLLGGDRRGLGVHRAQPAPLRPAPSFRRDRRARRSARRCRRSRGRPPQAGVARRSRRSADLAQRALELVARRRRPRRARPSAWQARLR